MGNKRKGKWVKTYRRNKSGWDDDYQPSYKKPKKVKFTRRKDKT
jgi:hypothetical protein